MKTKILNSTCCCLSDDGLDKRTMSNIHGSGTKFNGAKVQAAFYRSLISGHCFPWIKTTLDFIYCFLTE